MYKLEIVLADGHKHHTEVVDWGIDETTWLRLEYRTITVWHPPNEIKSVAVTHRKV